jgi:hypothetical protein
MRVQQVMFPSGQVRCAGDLYLPDGVGDRAPLPAVVMGHSVVMVKEALGPHADYLVRAGFVVLAVDYRTIGSSEASRAASGCPSGRSTTCAPGSPTCAPGPRSTPSGSGCGGTAPRRASPSWPAPSTGG